MQLTNLFIFSFSEDKELREKGIKDSEIKEIIKEKNRNRLS